MSPSLNSSEIVAIGSELLTPGRHDENSSYLLEELNALGIRVACRSVVGDEISELTDVLAAAVRRSPLVFTTGGLGPTDDDRTREAVAAVLKRSRVRDANAKTQLRMRFKGASKGVLERNLRQAERVEGAALLPNEIGTAPGQWCVGDRGIVVMLPGPPRELQRMFRQHVVPRLLQQGQRGTIARRVLAVSGLMESEVDERVAPICCQAANPAITILATAPGRVELHLTALEASPVEADAIADAMADRLQKRLGRVVYALAHEGLEETVSRILRTRQLTVAVAESCTGGMLGEWLSSFPGASATFLGGAICYDDATKTVLAGVAPDLLKRHGAVSAPVVCAMADGIRARCAANWGLAITGIAGPDGGSEAKPVGTVFIGISTSSADCRVYRHAFGSPYRASAPAANRLRVRQLSAHWALHHLYMLLNE